VASYISQVFMIIQSMKMQYGLTSFLSASASYQVNWWQANI